MRIALIRQRYTPFGGAERFLESALEALLERNVAITLYTRDWPETRLQLIEPHVVDPVHVGRLWRDRGFARAVCREVARADLDLVQSHERLTCCDVYRAGDGVHAVWLEERLRRASLPYRAAVLANPWHRYVLATERRMFANPWLRAVICNSRMVRDEIRARFDFPEDRLHVIYNAVDCTAFHPGLRVHRAEVLARLGIPADAVVFLLVGSGYERKGVATAIEALRELPPNAHLVVVGREKRPAPYRRLAQRLSVGSRVILAGPQIDPKPFYGAADVFVLPTIYDPFPNAALEAMASSLPVLTSTKSGAAELVAAKDAGLVCPSRDVAGLVSHMRAMLDAGTRERMGAHAREAVLPLTSESMTLELVLLYKRLLEESAAQRKAAATRRASERARRLQSQDATPGDGEAPGAGDGGAPADGPAGAASDAAPGSGTARPRCSRPRAGCGVPLGYTARSRSPGRPAAVRHRLHGPSANAALPPMAPGVHLYLRLLRYVRPYWWAFGIAVLGMVAVAAGDLVMAWLVIPIINNFQNPDPAKSRWLPLAVILVFVFRGVGSYVSEYGMAWTGHRVVFDLRRQLIDKLLRLPTAYYDQTAAGVVQSKLTFDAHQLASAASGTITVAIRSTLAIVASLGWMLWLNWKLTLLTFVVGPIVALVIRYFSRRLRRLARDIQSRTGSITHVLEEMIGGHRIVRVFGGEAYERERATRAANALRTSMTKQSSAGAASSPITQILAACAIGFIVWVALAQSETGTLDFATFGSYTVALLTLLERLRSLSGVNAQVQRGLAAAESIFALLDREEEPDAGTVALGRAKGDLRFDRVTLRYAGTDRPAIDDVTLHVKPGETVALVGPSGSGKTSLVNLIPRFYEPSAGRLFVDGHDVTTLTLASLRAQVALVSQDVLLFDDTVAANIAYGAMTGAPREAIERAAAAANALDFIRALPQGFDTVCGEKGVRLSGGQRQRIAIARAILKDAPVLILDEATSALDSESERAVQAALDALMRGRTTLVIAHRLSTIEHANRIVVMDEGRIVEQGTHAALVARDGIYARLHRIQFAAHASPVAP